MKKLGLLISKNLFPGAKILLYGELGAGKTTLVSFIINGLSHQKVNVTSPTFSLIKVYDFDPVVYHVDLYRLTEPYEIEYLDIFSDPKGIYLVEWANLLDYLLPENRLDIYISYDIDYTLRNIEIDAKGNDYKKIEDNIKKIIL